MAVFLFPPQWTMVSVHHLVHHLLSPMDSPGAASWRRWRDWWWQIRAGGGDVHID